jgi:hypothetical protein
MGIGKLRFAVFVFSTFILVGCTSVDSRKFSDIDRNDKSVYIQPGSLRILEPIKTTFRESGWTVNEFDPKETRYRLQINTKAVQLFCWSEWSELEVEVILLDNKKRSSVFVVEAKTCDSFKNLTNEISNLVR